MTTIDLTSNNSMIKDYFTGVGKYVPSAELIYLHTHPLITPNFVTELEAIIARAGEILAKHPNAHLISKFTNLAITIGKELPEVNYETAPKILDAMKEISGLCTGIIDTLGRQQV